MEILNSTKFIIIMLIVLVWVGLSGCAPTPNETTEEPSQNITKEIKVKEKAQKDTPGPTNFEGIVDVLGCMFAPDDCPLKKRQEEQKLNR